MTHKCWILFKFAKHINSYILLCGLSKHFCGDDTWKCTKILQSKHSKVKRNYSGITRQHIYVYIESIWYPMPSVYSQSSCRKFVISVENFTVMKLKLTIRTESLMLESIKLSISSLSNVCCITCPNTLNHFVVHNFHHRFPVSQRFPFNF